MPPPDIRGMINESLSSEKSLFVLSASLSEGRNLVQDLLLKAWQHVQQHMPKNRTTSSVRDLSIVRVSFPWSEHPAHMLFTSIMELRDLTSWETIVRSTLYEGSMFSDLTPSTHIAAILERIAYPGRLGTSDLLSQHAIGQHMDIVMPLFRAYLFDWAAAESSRSKLGIGRPLTTQDRYELLRCLWHCEQGVALDLDVQKHTRLWVYLDEAENILDYPAAERKQLIKGLTHLITHTEHFLTFWVNIAVQNKKTVQEVKGAFGASLLDFLDFDFTENGEPDS